MKLTAKQLRFVEEYQLDLCATQAAIRAGYSPKRADQVGYENLRKPEIQTALQKAISECSERTQIDADYILTNIKKVAERCMQAEPVMIKGENGTMIESGEYKFDASGANKALELLGKHLKLFTDKTEVTGKNNVPLIYVNAPKQMDFDEWERKTKKIMRKRHESAYS